MGVKRRRNKMSDSEKENLQTTTVYFLLPPPCSHSSAVPWIVATVDGDIRHPLTFNETDYNLPTNFSLSKLNPTTLAVSHNTNTPPPFDKLLLVPKRNYKRDTIDDYVNKVENELDECTLLSLRNGGRLNRRGNVFDDIAMFEGKIFAVDRNGMLFLISITPKLRRISICKTVVREPLAPASGSGWRKRLVSYRSGLHLVVRVEEKLFKMYSLCYAYATWVCTVHGFCKTVMFMARDCYFLTEADRFLGKEFESCIVFSEGAFPRYGEDCWEVNQGGDIGVFRFEDGSFGRDGENGEFPKIDWSPPAWVFDVFSSSEPERSGEEDEELVSNCGDEKDGETQSDSEDSNSKDSNDGETESDSEDSNSKDSNDGEMQSDSSSQNDGDVEMQSDSDSKEIKKREKHMEATSETGELSLKEYHHSDIFTTTVYTLPTLPSLFPASTDHPWITAVFKGELHHPLTLKHYPYNLPADFDITKLNPSPLAISHHFPSSSFDKLLVVPNPTPEYNNVEPYLHDDYLHGSTLLALCNGGKLHGCLPGPSSSWVSLSYRGENIFDDIILYNNNIYAVDRDAVLYLIINESGKLYIGKSLKRCTDATGSRWRNRLVVEWDQLYIVVRTDEKVFDLYKSISRGLGALEKPEKVYQFHALHHVLFMGRDCYFFWRVGLNFPGMHLENCIVFSQDAFPCYGDDASWDFSQTEDDIAVFRMRDKRFGREGEIGEFPRINWSPPPWVFDSWPGLAAESSSHSEREPEEDECLDSKSRDQNVGEMETDLIGLDKEHEVIESDTDTHNEEHVKMNCTFNRPENEDEEATQILLSMNARNDVIEGGSSVQNITQSIPRALTPCSMKRRISDLATTKFEGCDVRSDVVPTLQKIWRNHGNIIKNSNFRNRDMIARALEFLSDMVHILENNSALSLSDSQADYLTSTLSDLRCMQFEVNWLIPLVDKAIKLHGSKHLQEPLNRISRSRSQVEEREAVLLEELAKLKEEKNKLNEEEVKVSMGIPFCGKFKLDELFGSRLT